MKLEILFTALVLFTVSASSTVATFHGQLEKQGPKTGFKVGYASDQAANISLNVEDREGLNISYSEDYFFQPSEESRSIVRQGKNIPVKEFSIDVESVEPVRNRYDIPVTLTAYNQDFGGVETAPRVVQQREYVFSYITESSEDYSFDGGLIGSEEKQKAQRPESVNSSEEENSLTEENQTIQEEEQESQKGSGDGTTLALSFAVVLVFTYTIYEAIT